MVTLTAGAQAPKLATPDPDEKARIILDVTRVNMLFTVSDRKGRFVTNLSKDDFQVFEGKHQQSILEFTAESGLPLRLAVLIDTSNSIRDRFRFEQEAAIEFIKSLMRPEVDKAITVSFDTRTQLEADLTGDIEKLANRSATCAREAARRSTMRSSSPAATSSCRTSPATSSGAPW
jgi:VWFA-related protein